MSTLQVRPVTLPSYGLLWEGTLSIARLLISRGAYCEGEESALVTAAQSNFHDIVRELLAQKDFSDNDIRISKYWAEEYGCFDLIKIFAGCGKTRLVRGLLIAGSSFDLKNVKEFQAIHK